ncbi:MAG: hypothetical protein IPM96_14575 [Ignavibacteria bacterium]|nr:hypothetical protein [Ignavibacteria bacterium]
MKKTSEKLSAKIKTPPLRSMIALHSSKDHKLSHQISEESKRHAGEFDSVSTIKTKLSRYGNIKIKYVSPYLLLSAKNSFVNGKGHINAIDCHSVFPENPSISFFSYPDENVGPGKLEIWIAGLSADQKLTAEIRLNGYSYDNAGSYEVRSSMAQGLYGYFPVNSTPKIDLYFPNVSEVSGGALITVKPVDMTGTWIFHDVKINIIE